jgi:spore maturation protein CgeB
MKIAIIGKFHIEATGLHIKETLANMGHEAVPIDSGIKLLENDFLGEKIRRFSKTIYYQFLYKFNFIREIKSKAIYNIYKQEKIDLTIVVHDFLSKKEIAEIKKITSTPICIWFPDAISNFQKSMFFIAGYDYLFFKDKYVVNKLRDEYQLNAFYLPQCCNPIRHNLAQLSTDDKIKYGSEITNAGNLYPSRSALYRHLTQYNFKFWGTKFSSLFDMPELNKMIMDETVYNDEKSKAFQGAKIVLNNMHLAEIEGVNKRTFEIPACGGFQIITHNEAVNELFEIGKEIITYKNFDDLKSKIEYYLDPKNEGERQAIITAAHQRAINEHTYEIRLKTMLQIIFSN